MMSRDSLARRHGEYAGFVTRLIAFIIDRLIVVLAVLGTAVGAAFVVRTFERGLQPELIDLPHVGLAIVAGSLPVLFSLIYDVGCWTLAGQTPGKRLMGLLVVETNGERLKLGRALLRWLGYWLSGILFLGFLWILVDNRRQGFHDKLARTFVVYSRPRVAGYATPTPIRDRLGDRKRRQGSANQKPA